MKKKDCGSQKILSACLEITDYEQKEKRRKESGKLWMENEARITKSFKHRGTIKKKEKSRGKKERKKESEEKRDENERKENFES